MLGSGKHSPLGHGSYCRSRERAESKYRVDVASGMVASSAPALYSFGRLAQVSAGLLTVKPLFVPPRVYHTVGISPTLSPPIRLIGLVSGGRGAWAPLKFNSPNTFSFLRLFRDTSCFRAAGFDAHFKMF